MPRDATLNINATTTGTQMLSQLEAQLAKINTLQGESVAINKIARVQNQIQMNMLTRENNLLQGKLNLTDREIQSLGMLTAQNQILTHSVENRLRVATNASILQLAYAEEGITITQQQAVVANTVNSEIIAGEQAKAAAFNQTRKALMGASISMFVLNISVSQLVSSLKPLVEGNEAAEAGLKNLQGALALSLAPMQAFMAMQMIMTSTTLTLAQALKLFGGAMLFSIGLMGTMTSDSTSMRIAFSALAGIGAVLAATQFLASIATMTLSGSLATLQAVLGSPMGLAALAIGVGATAFAVGSVMNMKKAQTLPGHRKRVRSGGVAILDDDEVVQRESKAPGANGGGDTYILQFPPGTRPSDAERFAKDFNRQRNMGMMRKASRRVA